MDIRITLFHDIVDFVRQELHHCCKRPKAGSKELLHLQGSHPIRVSSLIVLLQQAPIHQKLAPLKIQTQWIPPLNKTRSS